MHLTTRHAYLRCAGPDRRPVAAWSRLWLVLLFAATLACSWQNGVVRGHFHSPARGGGIAAGPKVGSPTLLSGPQKPASMPADCPFCRELAHAGQFLATDPVHASAHAVDALPPVELELRAGLGPQRSHAWRSRGPPALA